MASDLPAPAAEAGLLFQRAAIMGDREEMRRIIAWGHQQIDIAYPESTIKAPLNLVRRIRAHQEWDKVARSAGKELRGAIVGSVVRDLESEILRRQEDRRARTAETRRQEAVLFNAKLRAQEHAVISQINARIAEAQLRLAHELDQKAADAESRRRKEERINEADLDLNRLYAEAIIKALGSNPTDKLLDAAKRVGHEIAEIRADPRRGDDDKHLQIQILIQSLPKLFGDIRWSDV